MEGVSPTLQTARKEIEAILKKQFADGGFTADPALQVGLLSQAQRIGHTCLFLQGVSSVHARCQVYHNRVCLGIGKQGGVGHQGQH